MLAYVLWHQPADPAGRDVYEARLEAFHSTIGVESAWFVVRALPWMPDGAAGYEDWYLVADDAALGELNERAVSGARRAPHPAAAARSRWRTAGLYRLRRGEPRLREVRFAGWRSRPADVDVEAFERTLTGPTVWQRQLALGPAPEYVQHGARPVGGDLVVAYG